MTVPCNSFGLGITIDEDGDVVIVGVSARIDEEDAAAIVSIMPDSAIQIAHQMVMLAVEARVLQSRLEGMTPEEKHEALEDILRRNVAGSN